MKKTLIVLTGAVCLLSSGCGSFWRGGATGAAAGVAGAGAGYELQARRQMDQIEADYQAGRITKAEYDIRKDQITRGSVFY
jgi:hypothetical protein